MADVHVASSEATNSKVVIPHEDNEKKYKFQVLDGQLQFIGSQSKLLLMNATQETVILPRNLTVAEEDTREEGLDKLLTSPEDLNVEFNVDEAKINVHLTPRERQKVRTLLTRYHKAFSGEPTLEQKLKHDIKHEIRIKPGSTPVARRPYRVPTALLPEVERQINELLRKRIIKPIKSEWSAPLLLVKKPCGSYRLVVDYRGLNSVTVPDVQPLPLIDDLLTKLRDCTYYTKVDLLNGFYQLAVHPNSIKYTAVTSHMGLFGFNCLPMGLINSPRTFMAFMSNLFKGQKSIMVYLDDVIIATPGGLGDHLKEVEKALKILVDNHLVCKLSKCEFAATRIKFLGFYVSKDGIEPCPEKTTAIRNFPIPSDRKGVRSFLGLANFYSKMVPQFASLAAPLYEITSEKVPFVWSEQCQEAFEKLKQALSSAPIIKQFDVTKPTFVTTDSSGIAIAGVLEQEHNGRRHVVEYTSRCLRPAEKNYTVTEQEMLAVVFCLTRWRHYLQALQFTLYSDHHALCHLTRIKSQSGRLQRFSILLSDFAFRIEYIKGASNCAADCLSRYPPNTPAARLAHIQGERCLRYWPDVQQQTRLDLFHIREDTLKRAQKEDKWCQSVRENLPFETGYVESDGILFKLDSTFSGIRKVICVPEPFRDEILQWAHDSLAAGHLGKNRTLDNIRRRYYWPRLAQDVSAYVFSCYTCQRFRERSDPPMGELLPIAPSDVWTHLSMDIIGPIHASRQGNRYILTFIDFGTRFAEAVPMKTVTSIDVCRELIRTIILRHGCPATITSDRGVQFVSKVTSHFFELLGITRRTTAAYKASTNGLCERFNKTVISILRKFCDEGQNNWDEFIPHALWHYNTSVQSSLGTSPYFMLYGRHPVLILDHLFEGLRRHQEPYLREQSRQIDRIRRIATERLRGQQVKQKKRFDQFVQTKFDIKPGDWVLVKNNTPRVGLSRKLLPKFKGPFRVLRQLNRVSFEIQFPRKKDFIHVSNLVRFRPRNPEPDRLSYLVPFTPESASPTGKVSNELKGMVFRLNTNQACCDFC